MTCNHGHVTRGPCVLEIGHKPPHDYNPWAVYATTVTTTLRRLLATEPMLPGQYVGISQAMGTGLDEPINLLEILDRCGPVDCLWALGATGERRIDLLIAADIAEAVLPLFEREYPDDSRPRVSIAALRAWAIGGIDAREALVARYGAYVAAWATDAGPAMHAAYAAGAGGAALAARDALAVTKAEDLAGIVRRYLKA